MINEIKKQITIMEIERLNSKGAVILGHDLNSNSNYILRCSMIDVLRAQEQIFVLRFHQGGRVSPQEFLIRKDPYG